MLPGGLGAIASGTVPVAAGSTLFVVVGGFLGFNGGGNANQNRSFGGGASDVRTVSSADAVGTLASRLLVAGGGGGASGLGFTSRGNPGGNAGTAAPGERGPAGHGHRRRRSRRGTRWPARCTRCRWRLRRGRRRWWFLRRRRIRRRGPQRRNGRRWRWIVAGPARRISHACRGRCCSTSRHQLPDRRPIVLPRLA
ncbi:glycine-rich protein [Antrihabitans spumae]|uniref:receptor protein-tyrosine kinase n=1 Tax=Antrihabitans spumae TaxID=3373370 RepID=A0ABW7KFI9_9NOCA